MIQTYPLILACDVGTSSVKVALLDAQGTRHGAASLPLTLELPQSGWAQQDPAAWWSTLGKASHRALAEGNVDPSRVAGVGLAAQTCAAIPLDGNGEALHPALIWLDTRSESIAQRITAGWPRVAGYGLIPLLRWLWITNGAPSLSGKDITSKILWFKEQRPKIWSQTKKIVDGKDYLLMRCTGKTLTTPDCGHLTWMMDNRHDRWSKALLNHLGLDEASLPHIVPSTTIAGYLTQDAAETLGIPPGLPVAGGVTDVTAAALGSGAMDFGHIHLYLGTSGWCGAHHPGRRVDPDTGVATLRGAGHQNDPASHLLMAAQEMAGGALNWAASQFWPEGGTVAELVAAAQRSPPGARGVMFLPWLGGERCPVNEARLRGGFLNLGLDNSRDDMARAVMEGVGFNLCWAMKALDKLVKPHSGPIHVLGGGAVSDLWLEMLADILERPLARVHDPRWGGVRGAAICMAIALGWHDTLTSAAQNMVTVERVFEPRPQQFAIHRRRFRQFLKWHRCSSTLITKEPP